MPPKRSEGWIFFLVRRKTSAYHAQDHGEGSRFSPDLTGDRDMVMKKKNTKTGVRRSRRKGAAAMAAALATDGSQTSLPLFAEAGVPAPPRRLWRKWWTGAGQGRQRRGAGRIRTGYAPWPPVLRDGAGRSRSASGEISVSEFFAKNRHMLGFRQPDAGAADGGQGGGRQLARRMRGSRYTAGTHHRSDSGHGGAIPDRGRGLRARHRALARAEDICEAPLRFEVPPAQAVARATGYRHLGRGHVRPAHDR